MIASPEIRSSVMSYDEPMAKHTSWRVGGPADIYFRPDTVDELITFLAELPPDTAVTWLGLGSNLLVRDGGLRGAVIATHKALSEMERLDTTTVRAEAGVPCAKLAKRCAVWEIGPAAFFAGIPGTVGGALAMNAGAFGGETWTAVMTVETIDHQGNTRTRKRDEYDIGYRSASGPGDEWFLAATFVFEPDSGMNPQAIRKLLARRKESQPIGVPSCGSVFRNPPGDHAARLIEAAGLKGFAIGGACVSEKHANFIINEGEATAADIEQLITHVQQRVKSEFRIELVPEVRVVGESA